MSDIILQSQAELVLPRVDIAIRPGVIEDLPFIDSLQKLHTKQVGWMPTKQLEGKIKAGHVLVAETADCADGAEGFVPKSALSAKSAVGYCIGNDQYFKRDDVGIIYQMNVLPGRQRGFIGASLLKAQFERSAYGCKLYCCWCAQDIAANRFWEAMGFVPLAFRAGSEKRGARGTPRVHIFWQKRIRAGDTTTPWWFPSKTDGGAIREDRIVLPIPPGTRWSDEMPILLPNPDPQLPQEAPRKTPRASAVKPAEEPRKAEPRILRNGLRYDIPRPGEPLPEEKPVHIPKPKPERVKRIADPKLISAARELRDRWLEQVNENPAAIASHGKYDVSRAIEASGRPALLAA